jgi:hypothetical protein
MKKFINPILRLGTALALLSVIYMQNNEINELKTKASVASESAAPLAGDIQKAEVIDSLENEVFNLQIINGRYEIALELLKEKNKKAADEYEFILTTQTE